jgi:N-methylhydantoinase A
LNHALGADQVRSWLTADDQSIYSVMVRSKMSEEAIGVAKWLVGIDTGGTFTDLIAFDQMSGALQRAKVPSVPSDPSLAVVEALEKLFAEGVMPADIAMIVHGTTVATNALLESKGVCAGLLITKGFRAVYEARGWSQPRGALSFWRLL